MSSWALAGFSTLVVTVTLWRQRVVRRRGIAISRIPTAVELPPVRVLHVGQLERPHEILLPWIERYAGQKGIETVVPISALRGDGKGTWQNYPVKKIGNYLSTFGEDNAGEVYMAQRDEGTIYRLVERRGTILLPLIR